MSYFSLLKVLNFFGNCCSRCAAEAPSQNESISKFLKDMLYISEAYDAVIMVDAGFTASLRYWPNLHLPNYTGYGGSSFDRDAAQRGIEYYFSRLRMALFGGVSLIAPMLVMETTSYAAD